MLASDRDPASYRALVHPPGTRYIEAIDQRALPHAVVTAKIGDADAAALAIRKMWVRGAPLIGAVGAYGLALALDRDATDAALAKAHAALDATRPTAVNLRWALDRVRAAVASRPDRDPSCRCKPSASRRSVAPWSIVAVWRTSSKTFSGTTCRSCNCNGSSAA